jgi:hypothetical protein
LLTQVEPRLDPHAAEDPWYFHGPPDSPEKLARGFSVAPHRVLPWRGETVKGERTPFGES